MDDSQQVRNCVTAVIYDKAHTPFFLIMKRKLRWEGWEFPKGGIEAGESEIDALKREIFEETGLQKFTIVKKLENVKKEFIGVNGILNRHAVYMIESNMNIPVHLPKGPEAEHSTYLWADSESVRSKLTWESDQTIFKAVLDELHHRH